MLGKRMKCVGGSVLESQVFLLAAIFLLVVIIMVNLSYGSLVGKVEMGLRIGSICGDVWLEGWVWGIFPFVSLRLF